MGSLRKSGYLPVTIRDSRAATFLYRRELPYAWCMRVAKWVP